MGIADSTLRGAEGDGDLIPARMLNEIVYCPRLFAPYRARAVTVSSATEGIIAKTDLIEAEDGAVVPVDYKRGAAPDPARVPGGAWPADRVQVAAQADVADAELVGVALDGVVHDEVDEDAILAALHQAATELRLGLHVLDGSAARGMATT